MVDTSGFISNLNPFGGFSMSFLFNLIIILIVSVGLIWIILRMFKFRYPVEIVQLNPLRVFKDRGSLQRKSGVQKLFLLKEKRWLTDFKVLPAKMGWFGKKEIIYLAKDESGDLRPLDISNICFAFTRDDGQIVDLNECYIKDETGKPFPITSGDIITEDGRDVIFETSSRFIPQNNDIKSSFVNSIMETVQKYHLPSFWQQAQVFLVIIAGFVAAIIIYIVNKS